MYVIKSVIITYIVISAVSLETLKSFCWRKKDKGYTKFQLQLETIYEAPAEASNMFLS